MVQRIQKWGNSLAMRIPKSFCEEVGVTSGSSVNLRVLRGRLLVEPIRRTGRPSRYRLKDLVGGITPRNLHAEVDTGEPRGRERL